ncbi:MAG: type II secretion system F family protein [Rhizobiaceae bacterium]
MEQLLTMLGFGEGLPLMPLAALMLLLGAGAVFVPLLVGSDAEDDVKRRLKVNPVKPIGQAAPAGKKQTSAVRARAMKTAQDFYAKTDPENVARLRLKLIQAGYMEPSAVGNFFVIRFVCLALFFVVTLVLAHLFGTDAKPMNRWILALMAGAFGYFMPGIVLMQKVRAKMREYRNGFPDFMDLMIVCSDAGMTMEAGIERVSKEIAVSYPSLAENLQLVSLELRAGRNLEDALKSLGDRLSLDEVRSFATLLQQSKELGTSLSGALRVFSDEMRHKRMSLAEEKAHALPAKMSVPVTVCILPVVLMIAIIPVIVKFSV